MIDLYRKKITSLVIQCAKEDPQLVLDVIQKLKEAGDIAGDDLRYLEKIAGKWIRIAEENLRKKG